MIPFPCCVAKAEHEEIQLLAYFSEVWPCRYES
jgi:hypothetical protein